MPGRLAHGLHRSASVIELERPGRLLPRITLALLLAMLALSCASVPGRRYTLDRVSFEGNEQLDDDEIEEKIASRESPRFLGLFPGLIYEYEIFDRHVLERDLQRIERYYRARGYYRARVRAGRVTYAGERGTRVEIVIEEGPPIVIDRVDVHGLQALSPELAESARSAALARLPLGDPFEEERFVEAGEAVRRALGDAGFASARVKRGANVDLPRGRAAVGFWIEPGSKFELGEVAIEGLGSVPEAPVRRALDLRPGDPYSESDLDAARQALLDLGAFSSVVIEPELERASGRRVPIRVRVVPSRFRTVYLGGGAEIDAIQAQVHLLAGFEHRNFFGGLRRFLVEVRPGLVLHPTRLPSFEPPERLLPRGKVRTEFKQPGFPEARTNSVLRGEISVYPVLLAADEDPGAPILGYRDYRAAVGVERALWKLFGALSHNLQINRPFTYRGTLDPDLDMVIVSYPELALSLDLRDNPLATRSGAYLALTTQVAGVGGDARDLKLVPDARAYVPLLRRLTLAIRGRLGLLFPDNYGDTLVPNAFTGNPGGASRADWVRDIQLLFLRGFFGGGAGSNRGYAPREIGPHGTVPFYNPGQSSEAVNEACGANASTSCDLPLGGLSLWEASAELRFPLFGPLTSVSFVDSGDVSPYRGEFRFFRLHLSAGAGLRYETPVGPVRFDVGYRIPGLQAPASADEGTPEEIFGLPIAVSLGIGEAF